MKTRTLVYFSISLLVLALVCIGCQKEQKIPGNEEHRQEVSVNDKNEVLVNEEPNKEVSVSDKNEVLVNQEPSKEVSTIDKFDNEKDNNNMLVGIWIAYGYWATVDDGGDEEIKALKTSDPEVSFKFIFSKNGEFEFTIADGTIVRGTYRKTEFEDWKSFNFSREYFDSWLSSGYSLFYDKKYEVYFGYLEDWDFVNYLEERQEIEWSLGDTIIVFKKSS